MTITPTQDAPGPCPGPWCEAKERHGDYSPSVRLHHFGNYRVVCTSCVLEGPLRPTEAEAVAAWNDRPNAYPELVAALEAALATHGDEYSWGKLARAALRKAGVL